MIANKKQHTPPEELCKGFPEEFVQYIKYIRSLKYNEKPLYNELRQLFDNLFKTTGYKLDYVYDWTT